MSLMTDSLGFAWYVERRRTRSRSFRALRGLFSRRVVVHVGLPDGNESGGAFIRVLSWARSPLRVSLSGSVRAEFSGVRECAASSIDRQVRND